ncbi:MAG: FAD-dependent oxidoreductase, partial [Burkholderiales bacterium]
QVNPFTKHEPDALRAMFGQQVGQGVVDLTISSGDRVFDLIRRHAIDCDPVHTGFLQGTEKPAGAATLRQRCEAWGRAGAKATWLDAEAIRHYSGSAKFRCGWLLGSGGTVHPLKYVRGLARTVTSLGGAIHGESPALKLQANGGVWTITTPSGVVNARRVILATNAYTTDLWPGLRETVVPLYSMQVATNPLPAEIGADILPGGQSMTDALRLIHYFRRDPDGRFVIGERGPFRDIPHESDAHRVIGVARHMYPALSGVEFPYRWSGKVAMTTDHMPHFHRLAPGLSAILGFNGRGVAMGTTLGQVLAAACLDDTALSAQFPVTTMHPIRMHSLNMVGVAAMIAYYRVLDQIA